MKAHKASSYHKAKKSFSEGRAEESAGFFSFSTNLRRKETSCSFVVFGSKFV